MTKSEFSFYQLSCLPNSTSAPVGSTSTVVGGQLRPTATTCLAPLPHVRAWPKQAPTTPINRHGPAIAAAVSHRDFARRRSYGMLVSPLYRLGGRWEGHRGAAALPTQRKPGGSSPHTNLTSLGLVYERSQYPSNTSGHCWLCAVFPS
jgi:hypothetical protein